MILRMKPVGRVMASIVNDTTSTLAGDDVAGSIRQKLSNVKKNNKIKFMGRDGLFIGNKMFANLETALDEALASGSSSNSTSELLELNEELENLRRQVLLAESALAAASEQVADQTKALASLTAECKSAKDSYDDIVRDSKGAIQKWKVQNETQRSEITKLNKQIAAARTSNDVDGLPALLEAKAELSKENALTQERLTTSNAERAAALAELNSVKAKLLTAEKLKAKSQAELSELIGLKKQANMDVQIKPIEIDFDDGLIKAVLGAKGLDWLVKAETQFREDMRERAYHMLNAVKAKNNKRLSGIVDLLQIAFDWIKSRPYAIRKKIEPWLNELGKDLRHGTLHSAQYYRELLEKVVGAVKKAGDKVQAKHAEVIKDYPWYETVWAGCYVLPRRYIRRAGRKVKSAVKPLLNKLRPVGKVAAKVATFIVTPAKTVVNATIGFFRNQYRGFYRSYYSTHLQLHNSGLHSTPITGCPKCAMTHDPERFVKQYQWVQETFPELFTLPSPIDKTPIVMFDAEAEIQKNSESKGKGKA